MPLFRRKTSESKAKSPSSGSGLIRTPSNRSNKSSPHSPTSPDSWGDENDMGVSQNLHNGSIPWEHRPKTLILSDSVLQEGQDIPEGALESPLRNSSRLSKTLQEILRDKHALSCFKSFMRSQAAEHIIQFWCDAESFHASTLMRLRTHSLQSISKSSLHKRRCLSDSNRADNSSSGSSLVSPGVNSLPSPNTDAPSGDLHLIRVKEHDQNKTENCTDLKSSQPDSIVSQTTESSEIIVTNEELKDSSPCELEENTSLNNKPQEKSVSDSVPVLKICDKNLPTSLSVTTHGDGGNHVVLNHELSPSQQYEVLENESLEDQATPSESSSEDIGTKLKKSIERDAVTIFSNYIAKDAPKPIGVDDSLRAEAISKICKENGEVDPECFISCQNFVLNKLDSEYYESFKDSEFHCRHQVHVLTTEKVFLPDILLNENALCYFMEFIEQEGASDLMQLWLAADNFQQQLTITGGQYDGEQAQVDAMVIYDRYFSLQATHPVGFDDKLRFEIEGNICREGGPLPDCFVKAKNIVLKILEKMYFSNYLKSQVYYRYLSDLISTVQMSEDMPTKPYKHKRTESDASSEHSAGSHSTGAESVVSRNTLLAVDTRKLRKVGTIEGDFSMNMDMLNPDDLWKRPVANSLILGSVNQLGQFVSHFEHDVEAEKKKGPILFKRRKEKEKEEEEMALRIAQMIISDVNTMTKTGENMMKKS
ncbi:A-kinase anchor protein 10, mitochondrial-like isoform X2 [Physella acuta]|uniref:A-kinase anchor protein 10, mitochondrial-like isoform X2 n=1 Tax=Physella acuta TaxID=109671 RepID=UPI0027DC94D0|nr:A-kinase anchor protein 10, mitochondrial-like isoform X2 [Physella acuta]